MLHGPCKRRHGRGRHADKNQRARCADCVCVCVCVAMVSSGDRLMLKHDCFRSCCAEYVQCTNPPGSFWFTLLNSMHPCNNFDRTTLTSRPYQCMWNLVDAKHRACPPVSRQLLGGAKAATGMASTSCRTCTHARLHHHVYMIPITVTYQHSCTLARRRCHNSAVSRSWLGSKVCLIQLEVVISFRGVLDHHHSLRHKLAPIDFIQPDTLAVTNSNARPHPNNI